MFISLNNRRNFLTLKEYLLIFVVTLFLALYFYHSLSDRQDISSEKSPTRSSDEKKSAEMASPVRKLISVNFEVFGVVQGVFFRKYTQKEATKLGLVGWVQNTRAGTVVGVLQGPDNAVAVMKSWLAKTGSPKSKIDKCDIKDEKNIASLEYNNFDVIREEGDTKPRKKTVAKKTVGKTKVK